MIVDCGLRFFEPAPTRIMVGVADRHSRDEVRRRTSACKLKPQIPSGQHDGV